MRCGHTDYAQSRSLQSGNILGWSSESVKYLLVWKDRSIFTHALCYSRPPEASQTNRFLSDSTSQYLVLWKTISECGLEHRT